VNGPRGEAVVPGSEDLGTCGANVALRLFPNCQELALEAVSEEIWNQRWTLKGQTLMNA
jgi:hypothetical protein